MITMITRSSSSVIQSLILRTFWILSGIHGSHGTPSSLLNHRSSSLIPDISPKELISINMRRNASKNRSHSKKNLRKNSLSNALNRIWMGMYKKILMIPTQKRISKKSRKNSRSSKITEHRDTFISKKDPENPLMQKTGDFL